MRRAIGVAVVLAVVGTVVALWPAEVDLPSPIESRFELLASEIYDVAAWARRLPYEVAVPIIARSKIRDYVGDLDLPEDVRERVLARVDSHGFVDEMVPFALALRDVYAEPEDGSPPSFDEWLRDAFSRDERIPGFEHSMFAWQEEESAAEPPLAFDDELVIHLVAFYDALYLQEADPAAELEDQLACARRATDEARAPAAERVQPIVRDLVELVRDRVRPEGEAAAAIEGILTDADRLQAVSISLVHFLDDFVCRHYRIFATRVLREQQLSSWMLGELEQVDGGRLWTYLEGVQLRRRHAVLIVVDGLQGHLMESLAAGAAGDRFLAQVLEEHRDPASFAPSSQSSTPAPDQQIDFLRSIAAGGFAHRDYLPFFRQRYADAGGIAEVGIATTPTISVRNLPIAKTGAPVAGAGSISIPNFHFVDRAVREEGRAYYFYGNDALQLERLANESGMKTLYDRLPEISSFSCAAQYDVGAHYRFDPFLNLALGEKVRDLGELRCVGELRSRAANERALRELRRQLLDKRAVLSARFSWFDVFRRAGQKAERDLAAKLSGEIAALEQNAMPELMLYYNPWPDHFAHFTGPFADEILAPSGELNRLDYWLGQIQAAYAAAGIADRTLFAMAGDHGLAPVFHMLNPEVEVFDRLREQGVDFRVEKISSDEGEGPRLTNPLQPPSMRGLDAVVASTAGGNYMIDLFADHGEGWNRQPLLSQLRELRLVDGSGPHDVVDAIYERLSESLDYMVLRVEPCAADGGVVAAIGARGGVRQQAIVERRGSRVFLDDAGDLLGVREPSPYRDPGVEGGEKYAALVERCIGAAKRDDPATWCGEETWRTLTSYTGRPDSVAQLAHLYDSDRAGTINLFPRFGIGYNTVVPGRHAGESFHEKDAFVGVWGAPVTRAERPRSVVLGALPATVYAFLSGEPVTAGEDGWGFAPIPLAADAADGHFDDHRAEP